MNDKGYCAYRGGGWDFRSSNARVAGRRQGALGLRYYGLGVRLVRTLTSLQQLSEVKYGK